MKAPKTVIQVMRTALAGMYRSEDNEAMFEMVRLGAIKVLEREENGIARIAIEVLLNVRHSADGKAFRYDDAIREFIGDWS